MSLTQISERLKTQDNHITANPMFCLQILVRDVGYDSAYSDGRIAWVNDDDGETVYEEPSDTDGWTEFGYVDRWEQVMVCFTEQGCHDYMKLDGHNVKHRAFNGETRIYVESFNRCNEMIEIRKALMEGKMNDR